jgi:hypothetical protein
MDFWFEDAPADNDSSAAGSPGSGPPGLSATGTSSTGTSSSGLTAALMLAEERASVVVLLAGSSWSPRLSRALAGQEAVFILNQQPTEPLELLQRRVIERVRASELPPSQLLWVAAANQPADTLDALAALSAPLSALGLEILVVYGRHTLPVEHVACPSDPSLDTCAAPRTSERSEVVWERPSWLPSSEDESERRIA